MVGGTHIVGMESLVLVRAGGAARAWRGRGAAPRPPAREYHRRARMPAVPAGRASTALRSRRARRSPAAPALAYL